MPAVFCALAMLSGCHGQPSTATATAASANALPAAPALPQIKDGRGLLLTFFDRSAQMRTVDRLSDVPSEARAAVMVTDPTRSLPGDQIFVTSLVIYDRAKDAFPVWIEERGQWLDRVMPRTSVAQYGARLADRASPALHAAKATKKRRHRPGKPNSSMPTPAAIAASAPPAPPTTQAAAPVASAQPQVIMFSTSWCPSCKMARAYFTQRGVRYIDIDVERNEQAAQKMLAIQQANGFRPGAVPLIIVAGKAYQGFSRLQIEVAVNNLGQSG